MKILSVTTGIVVILILVCTACSIEEGRIEAKGAKANIMLAQSGSGQSRVKTTMKGKTIWKDGKTDNLMTGENCVLVVIDYQAELIEKVRSIDHDLMTNNMQAIVKTAKVFNVPIIETTVAVDLGYNKTTIPALRSLIPDGNKVIDRVTLNGWQDQEFIDAVKATGRKKIIMTGLWTGGCPALTTLDALRDGYEVYAVSDAMGETSVDAHNRAMDRMVQAGAVPVTWEVVLAEWQRDYTRKETIDGIVDVMKTHLYPWLD